jgi:3-hydroxybutyryl-CoA dehydrogenase
MKQIGIVGAGAMGSGIAQVAAQSGAKVILYDLSIPSLEKAQTQLQLTMSKLVEKGKLTETAAKAISDRITTTDQLSQLAPCSMIVEAIVENLEVKIKLFQDLEQIVSNTCILASNTSSLSITALSSACRIQSRVIGLHFFNPAPLMPLVEIIPALQTDIQHVSTLTTLMLAWQKTPVTAKDTPGFIVNRVARPFYSEALRIYEEGLANIPQIDAAMRHIGFRMGPFELMDLIGNDVNYSVTKSVFEMFYFDPRYRPSLTQLKHVEAGWLGKKSKRGYYDYQTEWQPIEHNTAYSFVHERILTMLINEAYDAHYLQIASAEDLDLAMTKGVNYPKGLIAWGKDIGLATIQERMDTLYQTYREDRYRTSPGISQAMRSII